MDGCAESPEAICLIARALRIAVRKGYVALRHLAALAGVRLPADPVHRDGKGLVSLLGNRAEAHCARRESFQNLRHRLDLVDRNWSPLLEPKQPAEGGLLGRTLILNIAVSGRRPPCSSGVLLSEDLRSTPGPTCGAPRLHANSSRRRCSSCCRSGHCDSGRRVRGAAGPHRRGLRRRSPESGSGFLQNSARLSLRLDRRPRISGLPCSSRAWKSPFSRRPCAFPSRGHAGSAQRSPRRSRCWR